jgi:hydroxymethylpyrimidine pyrophosphatase-like HAD family hydrolase
VIDDLEAVAKCEGVVRAQFADSVHAGQSNPEREPRPQGSAARSRPYYVDVTHPDANKDAVVWRYQKMLGIPVEQIATIGDMPNDTTMFAKSGISIAMGQSSDEVKKAATRVATSSDEEGFANAIDRCVFGDA